MNERKLAKLLLLGKHKCEDCDHWATDVDKNPVTFGPEPFLDGNL